MPSDQSELDVIVQAQVDRQQSHDVVGQTVSEMKASLMFQYNWEEFIQPIPALLTCLGACYVASSSRDASVTLKNERFQHLSYPSLQANLVECASKGRHAFSEVVKGMDEIKMTSAVINNKLADAIRAINDPYAARTIKFQLRSVQDGADSCSKFARRMDKEFEDWLMFTCELHAACVQLEDNSRDAMLSSQVCLAAEHARLDMQKSTTEETRKVAERLEKHVRLAEEAFKKASDEFPTGWDLVAQQIVSDLAGGFAIAVNQSIPALTSIITPTPEVGDNIVGSFAHSGSVSTGTQTEDEIAPPSSGVPKEASDPAYAEAITVGTYLSALNVIVNGKDGNINWEMARGDKGPGSSANFIASMLRGSKEWFVDFATEAEPSKTLTSVLEVTSRVAQEIGAEASQSTLPEKDSEKVRAWQTSLTAERARLNYLVAKGKALPGNSAAGIPLVTMNDSDISAAHINTQTAEAQTFLESGKNQLIQAQQILNNSQEQYTAATYLLSGQHAKIEGIQDAIARLTSSDISMAEIKNVLIEMIKLVIGIKHQIANLVRFFGAISVTLDSYIRFQVEPFEKTMQSIARNGSDPNGNLKLGNYSLTDLQTSQVFNTAVTIRSYFAVFIEITKMWADLSQECVHPGLMMCDEMSFGGDPQELRGRAARLDKWSRDSTKRVYEVARKKQVEVIKTMGERTNAAKATSSRLAPLADETLKAITNGTSAMKDATVGTVQKRSTVSSFNIGQ